MAPRIVEVVGPAGVGKTTLCEALSRQCESIYLSNFPDVRKIANSPFYVWSGLQISPALLSLRRSNGRKLSRREFAWLSILYGWPGVLQKELKSNKVMILDQGPVHLFTETYEFGPDYLKDQEVEKFWQNLYSRWAGRLDLLIFLDAPDVDLLMRIRNRDKEHVVKNESVEDTLEFLVRFRKAYEMTISNLLNNQKTLQVLRFDTTKNSAEEIANQLLFKFGLLRNSS